MPLIWKRNIFRLEVGAANSCAAPAKGASCSNYPFANAQEGLGAGSPPGGCSTRCWWLLPWHRVLGLLSLDIWEALESDILAPTASPSDLTSVRALRALNKHKLPASTVRAATLPQQVPRGLSSARCQCGFCSDTPAEAGSRAELRVCASARGHRSAVLWGSAGRAPRRQPGTPRLQDGALACAAGSHRSRPIAPGCLRCFVRITRARAAPSPGTPCGPLERLPGRLHPAGAAGRMRGTALPISAGFSSSTACSARGARPAPRLAPAAQVLCWLVLL